MIQIWFDIWNLLSTSNPAQIITLAVYIGYGIGIPLFIIIAYLNRNRHRNTFRKPQEREW